MMAQEVEAEPAREIATTAVPVDKGSSVTDRADAVDLCLPCNDGAGDNSLASKAQVGDIGESTPSGCETNQVSVRPHSASPGKLKLELDADGAAAAPQDGPQDGNDESSWWQVAPQYRQPPNGVLTYQLCRHYKGPQTCQYGEACSFAHGEKELAVWVSLQAKNVDTSHTKDDSVVVRSQRPGNYVLCRMFLNGGCDMGNDCTFAHSLKELKVWNTTSADVDETTQRKAATATKVEQALVLDSNTPIRPPPTNVMCAFQLCKYLRSRVCPRGVECPFAHSTAELRAWSKARRKQRQMTAKTIMNDLSQSTEETEGEPTKSTLKKVRPPPVGLTMMPQLCSYFTDSHCEKGYFCSFAHSVEELRAWEKARQRGHITRPYPRHVHGPMILCEDGIDLCPLGSMCPRAHSEAELESWHMQRDAEMAGAHLRHAYSSRIRPRPFGFNGQFQLCVHFKAGRCTKHDCTFAHSEAERVAWETDRKAEKQHHSQQRSPQLSPQHGQYAALNGGAPAGSVIMVGDRYHGGGELGGYSYDLSPPGSPGPVYAPAPVPMSPHQQFAMMQQMERQMQQMQAMQQQQQQQQQSVGPAIPMYTPPTSPVRQPMYVQVPNSPPSFDLAAGMDPRHGMSLIGHAMPQSPLAGYAHSNYAMDNSADAAGALAGRAPPDPA